MGYPFNATLSDLRSTELSNLLTGPIPNSQFALTTSLHWSLITAIFNAGVIAHVIQTMSENTNLFLVEKMYH